MQQTTRVCQTECQTESVCEGDGVRCAVRKMEMVFVLDFFMNEIGNGEQRMMMVAGNSQPCTVQTTYVSKRQCTGVVS